VALAVPTLPACSSTAQSRRVHRRDPRRGVELVRSRPDRGRGSRGHRWWPRRARRDTPDAEHARLRRTGYVPPRWRRGARASCKHEGSQEMVLAWIRTMLAQASSTAVRTRYDQVSDLLVSTLLSGCGWRHAQGAGSHHLGTGPHALSQRMHPHEPPGSPLGQEVRQSWRLAATEASLTALLGRSRALRPLSPAPMPRRSGPASPPGCAVPPRRLP
jgi:hypothetical protein